MTDQVPHPPGPMRRPPSSRTVGTIFLAIGIALLVILGSIAAVLWVRQAERSDWPHADGTVVEVSTHVDRDSSRRSRHDRSGTTMYTPVVEFRVDGETHRFTSGVSTSDPWTVGDTVDVVYEPGNPSRASIAGQASWVPWMLAGMALLFGIAFGGVGLLVRRGGGRVRMSGSWSTSTSKGSGPGSVTYKDFSAPPHRDDEPRGGPFGGH